MRSLWSRIGLGALGVFAVGMLLITLGRQAKAATGHAIANAVQQAAVWTSEGAARAEMPFRLNGEAVGTVRQVAVRRARAGELPELNATVVLTSPTAGRTLQGCVLEPEGGRDMDIERGFRCAASEQGRISLGEVTFEPSGLVRRVMVTRDAEPGLREGDPFELHADLGGKVQVEATGDQGELVQLFADQHGANIKVNDEFGRSLVRLLADSTGAMLRVRDKNGRDVVRMQAGANGFSLTVDTAGH